VLASHLGTYIERLKAAVFDLCSLFAAKIETYAKQNARWTDRTGNARQGLTARAFRVGAGVVIYLFHTMSYGIWLEVKNQGRFAIILRTLESFYPQVMAALRQLAGGH
jgi:hypothetical protein